MKSLLLLAIISFNTAFLIAQESISLDQAIEIGLANNYQLVIANHNLEIANNNDTWSAAGRSPTVDASINWRNSYLNNRAPGFLSEQSQVSSGITPAIEGSWVVYDGNKAKITKHQLGQMVEQAASDVNIAVESVVQEVILAYYQVLIQEQQLTTLQEVLNLSRDRIDLEEARKEFGQAGTFDILQTTDAYLNDSTNILIQKNVVASAYRALNLAMGETPTKVYRLSDNLQFEPNILELSELEEILFANNENLKNLRLSKDIASQNTLLQTTAKRPVISLSGGLNYNLNLSTGEGTINNGEIPTTIDLGGTTKTFNFFVGATAAYNLYDGGNRERNIENAQVQELIAQANINDLERNLSSQLHDAFANYENQLQLLRLTEQLLGNAEKNLAIGEERFKGGLISSFDYRSIQLAFINASQTRLNALFNLKNTETELLRLTGQLVIN